MKESFLESTVVASNFDISISEGKKKKDTFLLQNYRTLNWVRLGKVRLD